MKTTSPSSSRHMIAVDTNILVHAHRRESLHYRAAARSVASLCDQTETWAIPWPCIHEFLAIVTRPKSFLRASPFELALEQIDTWLSSCGAITLSESGTHWQNLSSIIRSGRITGGAIHEARIAAICLDHGVRELWTADRDFSRFPTLATFNPLMNDQVHESGPSYGAIVRARTAGRRRSLAAR